MKWIFLIILSAVLSACATSNFEQGTNFTAEQVNLIKEGVTTKEQVIEIFGSPATVSKSSDGSEIWIYQYSKTTTHAQSMIFVVDVKSSTDSKILRVTFKGNVVQSYSYTKSPHTVKSL